MSSLSKVWLDVEHTERVLTLVDAQQVCLHVVTSTEDALANRAPGLACVQVLVQCQRHRVLETLPTNSTAKQEAGVRRSAGLTVIVIRDELGDAAGRDGVGVVVVAIRGTFYKENNKHTTSPRIVSYTTPANVKHVFLVRSRISRANGITRIASPSTTTAYRSLSPSRRS